MKEPDYQWQGAQGYQWWELDIVRDKFISSEQELLVKISDNFIVRVFPTKPYPQYYWSETYINGAYYETSCEHVDEDLYWLFENLEKLVFLHNTKKNKVKAVRLEKFSKKKNKILSNSNIKAFTIFGEVGLGERQCPVCGRLEFPQEANSYTICRFCGWEDESVNDPDLDDGSGPNYMSLNRYKKRYSEYISFDSNYIWEKSFKGGKTKTPLLYVHLKQEHKEIFEIVKCAIDKWDCMELLNMGCPKDEYDIEARKITPTAYRTDSVDELADKIHATFTEFFGKDTYISPKNEAKAVAEEILKCKATDC